MKDSRGTICSIGRELTAGYRGRSSRRFLPVRASTSRTNRSTRSAANSASSCSQRRMTDHWRPLRCFDVSSSRATFADILAVHLSELRLGVTACVGQPCQKHPSTKTAIFHFGRAMSMVRRGLPGTGQWIRYLRPRAYRARLMASSG